MRVGFKNSKILQIKKEKKKEKMGGGGGGGGGSGVSKPRQLDQTPTWAVASVCAIIILISIVLEKVLHHIGSVILLFFAFNFIVFCHLVDEFVCLNFDAVLV